MKKFYGSQNLLKQICRSMRKMIIAQFGYFFVFIDFDIFLLYVMGTSSRTVVVCDSVREMRIKSTAMKVVVSISRGGSRAAATSKMKCFLIIVNGRKPLTIITKHSILDVATALDPSLIRMLKQRKWCVRMWRVFFFLDHESTGLLIIVLCDTLPLHLTLSPCDTIYRKSDK